MATALEETPVSYEELAELEREFDDAETEMSACTCCVMELGARPKSPPATS